MGDETRTLLLVDDETENLIVLKALLDRDYRVLTAESAPAALEVLDAETVDVLITDQRMPEMQGTEVLSKARDTSPRTVRILLTGYADLDAIENRELAAGVGEQTQLGPAGTRYVAKGPEDHGRRYCGLQEPDLRLLYALGRPPARFRLPGAGRCRRSGPSIANRRSGRGW